MSLTLNEKIALLKQVGEEIVDLHELEDICRCETIPEKEIINAIHASVGAFTLDGVKFRCRPGMGRCQGGFCTYRALGMMQEMGQVTPDESLDTLKRFLQRRYKGSRSLLWGDQLREEQLVEGIYLSLLGMAEHEV